MAKINDLRAQVKKRQRQVGNKISRIKSQVGAHVAGTEFDPRKPIASINKMSSRDLNRLLNRLNAFQSRGFQFEVGAKNAPLLRADANRLKLVQSQVNKLAGLRAERVADIPLPGMPPGDPNTVGLRKGMRAQSMEGKTVNEPFRYKDIDLGRISGQKALSQLLAQAEKMTRRGHLGREIRKHRNEMKAALEIMGESDMMDELDNLTNFQFDTLWSVPGFAESIFADYEKMKKRSAEEIDTDDSIVDESRDFLDWARQLPETGTERDQQIMLAQREKVTKKKSSKRRKR